MNAEPIRENDPMTALLIGAAIEAHRSLGPGLLESVYQKCLAYELKRRGIDFIPNARIPILYKGESNDVNSDLRAL
jgi:GxxExxY protein